MLLKNLSPNIWLNSWYLNSFFMVQLKDTIINESKAEQRDNIKM
jgi:hypothetical protein